MVKDGETIVLGGLIKETNTNALKIVQTIKNENPDVLILAESYYLYPQITELLAEKYTYTKIITSPSLKSFDLSYFFCNLKPHP